MTPSMEAIDGLRTCTKCLICKPINEFANNGRSGKHTSCKQCARDAARLWRLNNPEEAKERDRRKHEKHRAASLERMRKYSAKNSEKRSALEKERYAKEKEKIKQRNKAYRERNYGLVRVWNNARRASEKRATPPWANFLEMAAIYQLAARMTTETGEQYHVDHIYPLRGRNVSGLHVQNNMQVIKAAENLKKGTSLPSHDNG